MRTKLICAGLLGTLLSACGAPTNLPMAVRAPGVVQQGLQAPRMFAQSQSRSDQVLDLVAQRMRWIYFQNNDFNKDGFITRDEIKGLDQWDLNGDGRVEFQEFDEARGQGSSGVNIDSIRRPARNMWNRINQDGDETLSREEVIHYFTSFYDGFQPDPNRPGDAGRIENYRRRAKEQAVLFFTQTDLDIDQSLSFSEYEDAYARRMLATLSGGPINSPI